MSDFNWRWEPPTVESDAILAAKARAMGLPEHFVEELAPLAFPPKSLEPSD